MTPQELAVMQRMLDKHAEIVRAQAEYDALREELRRLMVNPPPPAEPLKE